MPSSPNTYACFCLDSSIILADIIQNQDARTRLGIIEKHQKKLILDVFLPPTVKNECLTNIMRLFTFIGNTFRTFENEFRELKNDSGNFKDVTLDDLNFVQDFFKQNISAHKKPTSEYELLQRIEELVVNYLTENLDSLQSIRYADFVTGIGIMINKIATGLQYDFLMKVSTYKTITAIINTGLLNKLKSDIKLQNTAKKKPCDLQIICEVEAHQRAIGKWSILITLDKKDFLNKSSYIEKVAHVVCCDPLYILQEIRRLESIPLP